MSTMGNRSTLVHLYGAACGTMLDTTGVTTRNFQAIVLAAAVTDEDIAAILATSKAKQPGQAFIEMVGFVQNRDDYAELNSIGRGFR